MFTGATRPVVFPSNEGNLRNRIGGTGVWLLRGTRHMPDQRLTINQLDWHARGELPRRLCEDTGCYENASSCAHFLHSPGELPNARHTDLINKPMLALDQD